MMAMNVRKLGSLNMVAMAFLMLPAVGCTATGSTKDFLSSTTPNRWHTGEVSSKE